MPRHLWLVVLAVVAGCAQVPAPSVVPAPAAPADAPRPAVAPPAAHPLAATIAAWRQRALQHRAQGDLANAAIAWHVLTLLAPDDPDPRRELAATEAAIRQGVTAELETGKAAAKAGDAERATGAFLRALALDPENAEAARSLRELERRKLARIQDDRAARVRADDAAARVPRPPRPAAAENGTYDVEQGIEMFNAGDVGGGLRELRTWVEHNPRDRAGRQRVGALVFSRGQELEAQGAGEQALALYDAAVALRGEPATGWSARMQALRRKVGAEYYDRATRSERTDLAAAIKALETSVRYDPANARAAAKLAQLRSAQAKLRELEKASPK